MDPIRFQVGVEGPQAIERPTPGNAASGSFTQALGQAVSAVAQEQSAADGEAAKLAQGAGNLHETALALEKADVSMRVLVKARNKVIDAYQEVMRMSV